MEYFIVILVVAALAGSVVWHHRTKARAIEGIEFSADTPPDGAVRAISNAYCQGTKAFLRGTLTRMTVRQTESFTFHFSTRLGDVGQIEVLPGPQNTSIVRAATTELYIGSHPSLHFRRGILSLSAYLTNGIYKMLGIAPYAVKMKRFQSGLERQVSRQLEKASRQA